MLIKCLINYIPYVNYMFVLVPPFPFHPLTHQHNRIRPRFTQHKSYIHIAFTADKRIKCVIMNDILC